MGKQDWRQRHWHLGCGAALFIALVGNWTTARGVGSEPAPLAEAAKAGAWEAVVNGIGAGEDVNAPMPDGSTALHWSVYHDHESVTAALIRAGADSSLANRYGVRPLSIACQNGNPAIVRLLLDAGADPHTSLPGGETVLHTAARNGSPGCIAALLDRGAHVDAQERRGQTALMWAAAEGNVEAVDLLLQAGAAYDHQLPSGFTAYFFAVRGGHLRVVRRFLQAGVDPNSAMQPQRKVGGGPPSGMSGLLLAVLNGHFELAVELLQAGAEANDRRAGYAALHAVTWVRKPLRGDGDPPPAGSGSITSLEFVHRIVSQFGGDVNVRHGKAPAGNLRLNKTGATPFLLAAETGDLPLLKLLHRLGADPHLVNADHCTPLLAACGVGVLSDGDETAGTEQEAIETVKWLLSLGLDINATDDHGNTAMHGAAFKSWSRLAEFLASHGADRQIWNRPNSRGWTPLDIARGHRPGNFRPSPEMIETIERLLGADLPPDSAPAATTAPGGPTR